MIVAILAQIFVIILISSLLYFFWAPLKGWFLNLNKKKIYISTPMSYMGNASPQARQGLINKKKSILTSIESKLSTKFKVKHGLQNVSKAAEFEVGEHVKHNIIKEIRDCKYFILILDNKEFTSSLIEVGLAIANRKRCILCFKRGAECEPYLLKNLQSNDKHRTKIRKIEFDELDELPNLIGKDPLEWLEGG